MAYLDVSKIVFQRDEKNNLIPVEVELETLKDKPQLKITPMLKGEIQALSSQIKDGVTTDKDADAEAISKHAFNEGETLLPLDKIKDLPLTTSNAIMIAILSLSTGKTQKDIAIAMEKKSGMSVLGDENFLSQNG